MFRSVLVFAATAATLACAAASDLAHGKSAEAAAGHSITLRGKSPGSGWTTSMSKKLVRTGLSRFTVCGVWDRPKTKQFACSAAAGVSLPEGTELRLEQKPAGHGIKRRDSPGWGMIGLSPTAVLQVPLSNDVTGNKLGNVVFRVTLRNRSTGAIVYRSNLLRLRWHR